MRRDPCVLIGICVLFAAPAAMSQSDPQRPAESPSQQMTVPPAQQARQQRQRTQRTPEQAASQPEAAQGKAAQRTPVAEEKSSLTHHSARIGGQEIKYIATAATYNIKRMTARRRPPCFTWRTQKTACPTWPSDPSALFTTAG